MKRKKELLVILSSLLVIVLSVSVAYFTTKILGTGKEISVESADLKVIFTSGSGTINGTNIEPGWTSGENTFTVKNESNGTYKYNIIIKDLVNTFTTSGFLVYKITSADGGYNMTEFKDVPKSSTATDTTIAESISIEKGKTHTYKIIINYNNSDEVDQSADMGKTLTGKIFITKGTSKPTLYDQLLADKVQKSTARPDNDSGNASYGFSGVYTSDNTKTLYASTENGTTVYYFAGNATDNWVKFGKYETDFIVYRGYNNSTSSFIDYQTLEACTSASECNVNCTLYKYASAGDDIYWRIIRTNADGGIRLLYHSTSPTAEDSYIGTSAFNDSANSPKYVGYMYGDTDATLAEARTNTNNSTIKTAIDSWYASNLTNYTKYLSTTAIYCNDRELAEGDTYKVAYNNLNNKKSLLAYLDKIDENYTLAAADITFSSFKYASTNRIETNKTPTYDCTNTNDKFTVSASTGNGKLTYPIGLMTADEVSFAGGVYKNNALAYYYKNSSVSSSTGLKWWYTMSPFKWEGGVVSMLEVNDSEYAGNFGIALTKNIGVVRPVTSLKSCVKWKSGDGSASNPYEIVQNGGC